MVSIIFSLPLCVYYEIFTDTYVMYYFTPAGNTLSFYSDYFTDTFVTCQIICYCPVGGSLLSMGRNVQVINFCLQSDDSIENIIFMMYTIY